MPDVAVPAKEIADLFRKAIRHETPIVCVNASWDDIYCGNCIVRIDGYEIIIFNDCGELDYVDSVTTPDGRECDFDTWYDAKDEPVANLDESETAKMEALLEVAPVVPE